MKVRAVLSVHLFASLLPDKPVAGKYSIDKTYCPKDAEQRKCPTCEEMLNFGDTSYGNSQVWHGSADMTVKNCSVSVNTEIGEIGVSTEEEGDESDSDNSDSLYASFVDVRYDKKKSDVLFSNQEEVEDRALAQTITNAFCGQKNRDKFVPSFLTTNEQVKIYMYCCDKDVLLQSEYSPIFEDGTLSIQTLVLVWLAVNFEFFQTDVFGEKLRDRIKYKWPVSNFHKVVGDTALEIYQNQACRPQIIERKQKKQETTFHPEFYRISSEEKDIFDLNKVMSIIS